ncbi:hypothetical protein ACJMK2_041672 [Sinanodonta woodiana]|uniref:Ethanolaminephosphotransferase 1 n=1 Tax=Sinanodonta woodiana TaxID=1069815 RepID=A0ABD3W5V5_SINWO
MSAFRVLSTEILKGFDKYKYSSVDTGLVSVYITHPFWNWVVEFMPLWVAPNLLTITGFAQLLVNFALLSYYDPHFYASSHHPECDPIPNWVWLVCAINNFVSHTLDGIDGKQARRTKSSSPLGELFDHGLDSWATMFIPTAMYSVFGRGEYGADVYRVYLVMIGIMFCFIASHWEKYNTGVLFLPWGYDVGQIAITVVYLITFFFGYEFWKFTIPVFNTTAATFFEYTCYVGFMGLTFPPTLWNIYKSYRDKTGHMRSFTEAMRPLASTFILFSLMLVWSNFSSYNIVYQQPRLFYWTTGTVFAYITCKLIIAQMSNTRCELLNWLLIPLMTIVLTTSLLNLGVLELYLLWGYCMLVTITHVHFGVSVVKEMCVHLKINAFTLTKE